MPPPTSIGDAGEVGDRTLVEYAAAGDRAAFGRLYDRHVRPVYWQAYAIVRVPDEAEEVVQEVFIKMWRKISALRLVDESVLPWLLVTARYCALNARRRRTSAERRHAELYDDLDDPDSSVEATVEAGMVQAQIDKATSNLSALDRRLYDLCVDGDHTYQQAASELGVSHATVRNRLSRLRNRLRADLRSMRETS